MLRVVPSLRAGVGHELRGHPWTCAGVDLAGIAGPAVDAGAAQGARVVRRVDRRAGSWSIR